ncbi:decaprenyl-phosphate phosphoribosyltransferase [Acetobacteraceae bacterium]|nr:decaprenyl-phosphate phosphoribosyltransferase [Acetobacteraceae bacterium]
MIKIKSMLKLCRPHQWLKSVIVFAAFLLCPWDLTVFCKALIVFFAFSFCSSAIYCINDLLDVAADRQHPRKCMRPIASGRVTPFEAALLAIFLFVSSLALGFWAGRWVDLFLLIYVFNNILYMKYFKHTPVVDVFCISFGFLLRMLAGALGIGLPVSGLILVCTFFLTLFLGFSKRWAEANGQKNNINTRATLKEYKLPLLSVFISVTSAATLMTYGLWTISPDTVRRHHTDLLIYTLPLATFGLFRYIFILYMEKGGEDTARDILKDKPLLFIILLYAGSVAGIMFLSSYFPDAG